MTTTFYEVSVRFPKDEPGAEEALKQIFLRQLGYEESALTVTSQGRHGSIQVFCTTPLRAKRLLDRLKALKLKKVRVVEKTLSARDWRDKWKRQIKPFHLTRTYDVVPLWNRKDYQAGGREPIFLDTTLAFGTGLHETTWFMSQLIEGCAGRFKSFLDIGTGTGLLSVVAAKSGAGTLWAVDIDPVSIETARKNLAANGLEFDWCAVMDFAKFRRKQTFDFVAANVITAELIRLRARIVSAVRPGGYLAVSGVSLDNLAYFKTAFSDQPLHCLRILKGKTWTAILYRKR